MSCLLCQFVKINVLSNNSRRFLCWCVALSEIRIADNVVWCWPA